MESSRRTLLSFFLLGVFNNFGYVVMLSAAESVATGAAGVVLAANIIPSALVKSTAPWWAHRFSYVARIRVLTAFQVASFYFVALFEQTWARLLGVALGSIA